MENKEDKMLDTNSHFKKNSIVKITIHYCELKSEKLIVQPVVCMHVVDSTHGSYVKKQDRERAVTSFYENQRNDIDYIMPIMTQPCTDLGKKSQFLSWEESFILNENLEHLLKKEIDTVLFFEVIDLVPLSFTKYHYERLNENGMQKLAWAFLKVLGSNNVINTGSKLRLQLYKPHISRKKKASQLEVYQSWSTKPRVPLPASLYISFEQCDMLSMEPALRSMLPLQEEIGTSADKGIGACNESIHPSQDDTLNVLENKNTDFKWLRKEGEPFEVPEQHSLTLESAANCRVLKFSSLGRILVAGCGTLGQYLLLFYEIPSGKMMHKIAAHSDVIYDLDWSQDDEYLLSASADYCVKLWNIKSWNLSSTFIHPSFVYSAKFQPALKNILVSGCFDHVIRVWTYNKTIQLLQELEGHNAAVNTLCWFKKTMRLFSADDIGDIKIWKILSYPKTANRGLDSYVLDKDLRLQEIKGIPIIKIVTNISESVLFLFCGDTSIRLVDSSLERIFTCYESFPKSQSTVNGCCSPCGNLLFLYNGDGCVLVWKRKTSEITTTLLNSFDYYHMTSIDYHPLDHILALTTSEGRIQVYTYKESDKLFENKELYTTRSNLNEIGSKTDTSSGICMKSKIEERYSKAINLHCGTFSVPPQKDRNELENSLNFHEKNRSSSKQNMPKNYMYNADTSSDEGLAKQAFNSLNIERDSSENEARHGKSIHYCKRSEDSESFTAVITKSGEFSVLSVPNNFSESANLVSGSQSSKIENPNLKHRSSKRSQRRKRLREMSKTTW
ncbi:hypothetical protein NPIL_588021 [Nephila pilipes]|uniref:Jouberin n=1 Tax=Nephila pilipes TaxID=299642 RepID=A0A8X6NBQ8_NEPPI|nr:hypothetical protein NPIL_588021 [Nephila pilipes]